LAELFKRKQKLEVSDMSNSQARRKLNLGLYKKLYLARKAELEIRRYYSEDEMKTPMHMSMGEEAITIGVCHALKRKDQVFGTYRSHALYLAKTQDVENFFAEMYGKETSRLKGKGGSMHLFAPDDGFMGTSAIVASIIPPALGAAFANKTRQNGKTVAVFFGDGAVDEGNFWESLNIACLMKLPILFICEDNGFAIHTPASERHGYKSLTDIVSRFNCHTFQEDSTDAEVVYRLTRRAVALAKKTQMPSFLHLRYYRYLEHVGIGEDFDAGYRAKGEFKKWYKRDPVTLERKKLIKLGIPEQELKKLERRIDAQVARSIRLAKKAPFTKSSELYKDVYHGKVKKN
jgi:TPP-dependent pyruvate/acetoin dehydrogenase alpha subunit